MILPFLDAVFLEVLALIWRYFGVILGTTFIWALLFWHFYSDFLAWFLSDFRWSLDMSRGGVSADGSLWRRAG